MPRGLSPAPLGYMPSIVIAAKITAITANIAAAETAADGVTEHYPKLRLTLDPFTPSILHLLPSYNRFCFRLVTFDDIDAIFMSYV